MAVFDGEWQLVLDAPMGRSAPKLTMKTDGTSISGTWKEQFVATDFTGGELDGNRVKISLQLPVSGHVAMSAMVVGDKLSGEMRRGRGKFPVTGTRVGKSLPRV